MQTTKKIWMNGKFIPWDQAKVHILTHSLHYGSGVFEGIRAYDTKKGTTVFQLDAHINRLYYSAKAVHMEVPWTKKELKKAIIDTIKVNKIKSCYIRPIFYYGYGELRVGPGGCPTEGAIAVWPWGSYLGEEAIRVKVSDFIRIHPRSSVTDAKICGHYINSMLAGLQATKNGYSEALLLDYDGNVAEGPGENFFMVKDGKIVTPLLGAILDGITRGSVIALAKDLGFKVEERTITLEEIYASQECFFTGTAAEVTPIGSINDKIISKKIGPITKKIKDEFAKITKGENEKYHKWLTIID